jgi:7,8-dihydropterin-6-yl-methyl-4-(beta-D-ribofuranosyl)aminobenzene 5'-phosphate synthase
MIRIVYDNKAALPELTPEWGFSSVVDGFERTVLFDTGGDGEILLKNMDAMGLSPADIDVIMLSHAHWDHLGGVEAFLQESHAVEIVLPVDFPAAFKESVRGLGAEVFEVDEAFGVCDGLWATRVLRGGRIPELAMYLQLQKGACGVVVTGCAHPGIINVVESVREDFPEDRFAVLGGFHLKDSTRVEVQEVIGELRRLGARILGPCHCSGDMAIGMMRDADDVGFVDVRAGVELSAARLCE